MSVTERTEGEKRAYLAGFRAGIIACADHGRNAAEDMAAVADGTLPQQPRGAVDALDFALRTVVDPDLTEYEIRERIAAVVGRTLQPRRGAVGA